MLGNNSLRTLCILDETPYHRQDTPYYCGAACAQMVLKSLPESAPYGLYDQDHLSLRIFENNTSDPTIPWASAPDGLEWVLERFRPAGDLEHEFRLIVSNSESSLSRRIVWTIHKYKVPPIVLVHGMRHWVTVYGYDISAPPKGPNDCDYEIRAFFIRSTSPNVTRFSPFHTEGDYCGRGQGWGIKSQHVTYRAWQKVYMKGIPWDSGSRWAGRRVAVCYVNRSERIEEHACDDELQESNHLQADKSELWPKDKARETAKAGLVKYGLLEIPPWKGILEKNEGEGIDTANIDAGDPLAVNIPTQHNAPKYDPYYVVPMESVPKEKDPGDIRQWRRRPILAIVDAYTGEYLESVSMPSILANAIFATKWKDLKTKIINDYDEDQVSAVIPFAPLRAIIRELPDDATAQWLPCPECASRFLPVFIVGDLEHNHYHIRADGYLLDRMHGEDAHEVWGW